MLAIMFLYPGFVKVDFYIFEAQQDNCGGYLAIFLFVKPDNCTNRYNNQFAQHPQPKWQGYVSPYIPVNAWASLLNVYKKLLLYLQYMLSMSKTQGEISQYLYSIYNEKRFAPCFPQSRLFCKYKIDSKVIFKGAYYFKDAWNQVILLVGTCVVVFG